MSKWRNSFAEARLEGLLEALREGAARIIGDDVIEALVLETLYSAPLDATHWSIRSLAAKLGSATLSFLEIWRVFGLKLWHEGFLKVSLDSDLF